MQKTTQATCNLCRMYTNHTVLATEEQEEKDRERCLYRYDLYEMLKCLGCNRVLLRHTHRDQDDFDDESRTIICYPPRQCNRGPAWPPLAEDNPCSVKNSKGSVPDSVCALMREVYAAIQNNSLRLATMGIRAALERTMIEKVGDQRSFKSTMDAFQRAGYLSVRQALSLDSTFEAGHAATHRAWEPTTHDISTLLDITKSIIEAVYLHEDRVRDLDRHVPKRLRPNQGSQSESNDA
jgi:hypothetical protein